MGLSPRHWGFHHSNLSYQFKCITVIVHVDITHSILEKYFSSVKLLFTYSKISTNYRKVVV